jgi:hypothetical protein
VQGNIRLGRLDWRYKKIKGIHNQQQKGRSSSSSEKELRAASTSSSPASDSLCYGVTEVGYMRREESG